MTLSAVSSSVQSWRDDNRQRLRLRVKHEMMMVNPTPAKKTSKYLIGNRLSDVPGADPYVVQEEISTSEEEI